MSEDIFISKYRCEHISEFVGNEAAKKATVEYYTRFKSGKSKNKAILYQGPPGTGKTTLAILLAKSQKIPYEVVNASNLRKESAMRVGGNLMMASLMGKTRLTILDECDRLDKRTQATLAKYVKNSKQPIVITANYPDKISKTLKYLCISVNFNKPTKDEIYNRLKKISELDDSILREISEKSDTIRTALNSLQTITISGNTTDYDTINSYDKVDLFRDSVINGNVHRQKLTPDEIVTYLHDSRCDPRVVSDLDIISGRSRKIGYDQWLYFYSYFDNVRLKYVCKFPYTWVLIKKMRLRRTEPKREDPKLRKLTKKEVDDKKTKKLGAFF